MGSSTGLEGGLIGEVLTIEEGGNKCGGIISTRESRIEDHHLRLGFDGSGQIIRFDRARSLVDGQVRDQRFCQFEGNGFNGDT